jgi:ribonuclease P protein component
MTKIFSYGKEERLKSRKLLQEIFSKGKTFTIHPVKIFYLQPDAPIDFPVKVGVGASGRHFKKAVDRNRIKRLLREAYRTEKSSLHEYLDNYNRQIIIFLLYIDKALPDYATLKIKMPLIVERLIKQLNEACTANT